MALTRLVTDYKDSVRAATTTNINLTGGAPNVVDGVSLSANDRVLVKSQTDPTENGIFRVTTLGTGSNGTWYRTSDFNDFREISGGALTFVESGTLSGNVFYYIPGNAGNVQVGTSPIQFSNLYSSILNYFTSTTNNLAILSTAASTSSTTGALTVAGGVGIGGNLNVAGNLVVTGNTTFLSSEIVQVTEYAGNLIANSGVAATSTTSGALQVTGGAGVTGNLYVGGNLTITGNVSAGGGSTFIKHSTGTSPPATPSVGDTWYNTTTDILYEYIRDGANNLYWVDITNQPNSFANLVVTSTATISNVNATTVNYTTLTSGGVNRNAAAYTTSTSSPANPRLGDQWYDTGTDSLYTYFTDGISTFWLDISDSPNFIKFTTSASAPVNPAVGDQWYDSSTDTLYTRISDGVSSYWLDILNFPEAILYNASSTPPATARSGDQWYDTTADVLYTRVSDGVSSYWVDLYTRSPAGIVAGTTSINAVNNGPMYFNFGGVNNPIVIFNSAGATINGSQTITGAETVGSQTITGSSYIYGNLNVVTQTSTGSLSVGANSASIDSSGNVYSKNILPTANVAYNLGSATSRWNIVYTGDLELSNGIGDWTIVEGEEDLFIYNNKRNKVYKFNLTEVDPAAVPAKKGA